MSQRLASLDAFRGFTIAAMVLVNNPGDWKHVYAPLLHAPWHGWTFTDLVFPFFLFIVGVSMAMSSQRQLENGQSAPQVLLRLWVRCAIIIAIGLTMSLIPHFDFSTVRVPGVLQRIGLASAIAAPMVVMYGVRAALWSMLALFGLYSVLMLTVPVPDAHGVVVAGALEAGRDFGAYVDRAVFGDHVWRNAKTWDPEGLVSTMPAVGNVFAGAMLGKYLRRNSEDPAQRCAWMFVVGFGLLAAGGVLDFTLMPINKNLWTVSYSVFMSGWALVFFSAFYWLMDACAYARVRAEAHRLFLPFTIFGMNALFIFVLSGIVGRLFVTTKWEGIALKNVLFSPLRALPLEPRALSLLFAIAFSLAMFSVAWWMWRKRWFIKV